LTGIDQQMRRYPRAERSGERLHRIVDAARRRMRKKRRRRRSVRRRDHNALIVGGHANLVPPRHSKTFGRC
jgi:hypothetical protein